MASHRILSRTSRILTPLVPAITVLVLGTVAVQQWTRDGGTDAAGTRMPAEGHWQPREHLPVSLGAWVSQPWQPMEPGRPLLRNVQRHGRVYEHVETGQRAAVLMVRAGDRRDLLSYALPQWYTDRGWQVLGERAVTWHIQRTAVPAMEHEFSAPGRTGPTGAELGEAGGQMVVTSFVIDASGGLGRTLDAARVSRASARPAQRSDAGVLVHVAFAGDMPPQARQSAMNSLMSALILSIEQDRGAGDKP